MNELMVLVEQAVRPVRAGPVRKLRIREELLAHLTAIYEDERARLGDDGAALAAAVRRFGDPAALTPELEESLSFRDRLDGRLDRWFGWRSPESAARYTLRLAGLTFLTLLPFGLVPLALAATLGTPVLRSPDVALHLRTWAALLVVGTADVFLLGWLYYQVRDAWHGTPWATRSRGRAAGYATLFVPIFCASAFGLHLAATLDARVTLDILLAWDSIAAGVVLGVWTGVWVVVSALKQGPDEIRHTIWSSLDIGGATATVEG